MFKRKKKMRLSKTPIGADLDRGILFKRQEVADQFHKTMEWLPRGSIARDAFERGVNNTFTELYVRVRGQDDEILRNDLYARFRMFRNLVTFIDQRILRRGRRRPASTRRRRRSRR